MNKIHQVIYPLASCGGKLKDNTELRISLRSLGKHLKGDYEVAIVGSKLPDWGQNLRLIECSAGRGGSLKDALRLAAEDSPDGFTWIYDDCCLIKDMTTEELKVTPCSRKYGRVQTKWGRSLNEIKRKLNEQDIKAWDYSRPHGPYWYDKSMIDEAFEDWPNMKGKFPFESWILSKRDHPRRHDAVKQYYGPWKGEPAKEKDWWFLNYSDRGNSTELRNYLHNIFPTPSRFECHEDRVMHKNLGSCPARFKPVSFKGNYGDWQIMRFYQDTLEEFLLSNKDYLIISNVTGFQDIDMALLPSGFRGIRIPNHLDKTLPQHTEVDTEGDEMGICVFSRAGAARFYDHLLTQSKWKIGVAYEGLRKYDSGGWYKIK